MKKRRTRKNQTPYIYFETKFLFVVCQIQNIFRKIAIFGELTV